MRPLHEVLPALLDALETAEVGAVGFAQHDGQLEKWFATAPAVSGLGYSPEEWMAKPMYEVLPPEQRPFVAQLYERLASDAPVPPALELRFIHRDGHEVRVEFTAGRCPIPGGHALVLITRSHPRALSLLEADRIALVGALAAGFAHETNNPLTSVLLNLRSLRKQILTHVAEAAQPMALRCLDDITVGAERIASNVRALQTLATRGATQKVDLAAVVSSALRLAAPTLDPRAHVIRQIFPVRPVAGEEARIGQAVLAMLLFASSGFDAASAGAGNRIVVAVEERDGWAVIEVSDNGQELTPAESLHAFDPFFRTSERGAGVGVGLGVARSVASALGGDVVLGARSGGGAVVTMRLPLVG